MNLEYIKPNMDEIKPLYEKLLTDFNKVKMVDEQLAIIEKINAIRDEFFSMEWLSYINYLLNVKDDYYISQEDFFALNKPIMENFKLKYYQALLASPFKNELKEKIGNKVFQIAKLETKLLNDKNNELITKEKKLKNEYSRLLTAIKVNFNNEEIPLSKLNKYLVSSDRNIRIKANIVKEKALIKNEKEFDKIMHSLIKVRTDLAHNLGFASYTDVGYISMKRIGYDKEDIAKFRKNIVKYVVPFVLKLKEKQRQKLALDKLMYYDNPIIFKSGNPLPLGDSSFLVNQALKMYNKISPKIYDTFKLMVDNKLMDLDIRPNKFDTGITTYIPKYKVPIFISNFRNTDYDVCVLTHEFGHSFQLYSSRNLKYYENWWPTFDTCEIHSQSMELLTLPYMNYFFKEPEKYVYKKLANMFSDFCFECIVDEFQHEIYDHPNWSSKERKDCYIKLEKTYRPWMNFAGNDYLSRGNGYQLINHIFHNPFYYIDYALANSIALQFYLLSLADETKTWDKYINLCELGGKFTYLETITKNGLKSPFDDDYFKEIVEKFESILKA